MRFRIERDTMGEVQVPQDAYWGAQTQRAFNNFQISGIRFPKSFIRALGIVKRASAEANMELHLLDRSIGEAIIKASKEVIDGKFDDQFIVDVFQTGSGTSTNMNANEVIANRANELLGGRRGEKHPVHPNDHVNMCQSSNDVIPTCMHIAAIEGIEKRLLPSLSNLRDLLYEKSLLFDDIIKIGRTHLQDATPIRLGQEFSGYHFMVTHGIRRVEKVREHLFELPIGGTAVGTGINAHPKFAPHVIKHIRALTALPFREAENHFEAQGARDAIVETSGALKCLAVSLMKIANDIRWLSSGPRCGIGEITIPELQPGSSIMPGKVNPVIPEVVCQVSAQVIGNDAAISIGGLSGNFELNTMMPLITHNILQSIDILSNATEAFADKCISGIKANKERCEEMVEKSLSMCTALTPHIGYDAAAEIAKEAYRTGKTIREVAIEKKILPPDLLEKILDPRSMT
ncbi:MAG: class II fumarate hydratase [Nitrospirae bacterium]|nr:MAG: class II fumarate hydratase [Nitrospirota bacterium]